MHTIFIIFWNYMIPINFSQNIINLTDTRSYKNYILLSYTSVTPFLLWLYYSGNLCRLPVKIFLEFGTDVLETTNHDWLWKFFNSRKNNRRTSCLNLQHNLETIKRKAYLWAATPPALKWVHTSMHTFTYVLRNENKIIIYLIRLNFCITTWIISSFLRNL